MSFFDWLRIALLSGAWGGSFFFVEIMLGSMPPITAVFGRLAVGLFGLSCLLKLLGHDFSQIFTQWRFFAFIGFINNALPFTLINFGQTQISGSLASIINATTPIVTAIMAHWLTIDERLTINKVMGIALGFSGILVLFGPTVWASDIALLGMSAGLIATICYAYGSVISKRLRHNPPLLNATGQVFFATLWVLPVFVFFDKPWSLPMPDAEGLVAMLAIGFLSTTLGMFIYFQVLKTAGASNVVLVTFLVPITATGLGFIFLEERLAPNDLVAFFLITLGLVVIDGRFISNTWKI